MITFTLCCQNFQHFTFFGHVFPRKSAFVGFAKMNTFRCHQLLNKKAVGHFCKIYMTAALLALFLNLHTKVGDHFSAA